MSIGLPPATAGERHDDLRYQRTGGADPTVDAVMLRHPKTLSAGVTIAAVRAALTDEHVHMVLLTEGTTLVGTVTRADLPAPETAGPALPWSTLHGRTVPSGTPAGAVHRRLIDQAARRLAVVTADGSLLGLMCLKHHGKGFCSDADVAARSCR